MPRIRIFYTSDLHGADKCFGKFINAAKVYKTDALIIGGDLTGKQIIPIVRRPDRTYQVTFLGETLTLKNEQELEKTKKRISSIGYYIHVADQADMDSLHQDEAKLQATFGEKMREMVSKWVELAEQKLKGTGVKLYMMPGNDDDLSIDPLLEGHESVVNPNEKVVTVRDHEMISLGYANMTPWKCPRDVTEEKLGEMLDKLTTKVEKMDRAIFNLHAPPYKTSIDLAPELDENFRPKAAGGGGVIMANVGSTAVRKAIEDNQPLLTMHGHIHDSRGMCNIGRTLCLNPGSEYIDGILRGVIVDIEETKVKDYLFTSG